MTISKHLLQFCNALLTLQM